MRGKLAEIKTTEEFLDYLAEHFSRGQHLCNHHAQDTSKICYCTITGKICRKDSCPRLRGQDEEEEDE